MTVRSVDSNDLLCGDILLIESEDEWIIHRLLALRPLNEEIYAITRGDNADNLDQPVPIKRILGKVTEIRRDNRDVPIPPVPAYNNVHEAVLLASFPSMVYPFSRSRNSSTDGHAEGVASSALAPHVAASRPYHRQTRGLVGSSRRLDRACSVFCGRLNGYEKTLSDITCGMDEETFLSAADRECLSPLIYFSHRHRMASDSLIASHLKKTYLTTLARNTVFLEELGEVSSALQGMEFILLKGAYLALRVYASPGARQFSDIDILIKPGDFQEVHSRLTQTGYKTPSELTPSPYPLPSATLRSSEAPSLRSTRGERIPPPARGWSAPGGKADPPLVEKVRGNPLGAPSVSTYLNSVLYHNVTKNIPLHIHWHLLNSTLPLYASVNMDIDEIWKSARKTCAEFMELCPEHLIIHLSEHALRHSFDRLILLRDIAEILCKFSGEINWDRLITDSRKFKLSRAVYYTLLLTARKTGVYVPVSAFEALNPKRPGLGEKLFLKLITGGMCQSELCSLVYISNSSSFRGKISLAWRMAFPPRSVLAQAYNRLPHEIGLTIYIKRLLRGFRNALFATGHFLINSRTPRVMAKRRQTMLNPRNDLASKA